MPCTEAKARKLLKQNKAKIIKYEPFTIQLLFECDNQTQNINLGVDAGSKHIGLSATTINKELYSADIEIRNDIVGKLASRREIRKTRRGRLRYRQPRFDNRINSKNKGWLAPSVEYKINSHISAIQRIHAILPVTKIIIETAQFDIQKIQHEDIRNEQYQQGDQLGFWNVREYIIWRDGHMCRNCGGKSKDKRLNVHHIESRKTGGNAPNNLITLCETCHTNYHNGNIQLKIKRGKKFNHEAFMGIMRKTLFQRLTNIYPYIEETYGYITKNIRIQNNLPKEHYIDAKCISGNPQAEPMTYYFYQKRVRKQNRKITKDKFIKNGKKQNNQLQKEIFGFQLFDSVQYKNEKYFIFSRRTSGYFDIRDLYGNKINNGSIDYKKLKLIQHNNTILTEKRNNEKT